jgi:glucose-6-phosphate dehydrogenase assembly protein OpcA
MSTATGYAWAGQAIEPSRIEDALRQAWREEAERAQGTLAARTNVLNLIVHSPSEAEGEQVAVAVGRLGIHHPSRSIIVVAEPDAAESSIAAWVKTHVQALPGSDRRLFFEQVTLAATGEAAYHLPPVIDPILISELPDFLWWLHEPPFRSPGFSRMVDLVNRLIIDSATFTAPARAMHELAELVVIPYGVALSDFAWDRLRPWRELVAQFFDPPEYAPSLSTVERVTITYEPGGDDRPSGLSAGLLALGWLCSRLGWLVDGAAIREGAGAYRWTLSAGGRTVEAALLPDHYPDRIVGPRRIALDAVAPHACSFQAYRESDAHIATQIDGGTESRLDRVLRASEPDEDGLLLRALNQFGRDQMYDGAVVFAAQLARGIDD